MNPAPVRADREALLLRVARGDQAAFAELYDDAAAAVLGLIRRVLRDAAQSEEVLQEVFLEVWQRAARYEPQRGGATAWIMTCAHRRAVDRVRSAQSAHDRDVRVGARELPVDYDAVAEHVEIRIEHERAQRALSALTDLQREAVTLAYYGGYSQSEVAELLGVPLGTVKTRMRDGMIRLRDELGVSA